MKMTLNMSNKTSKFYIVPMSALPQLLILFHEVFGHNVTTINFRFLAEKGSSFTILKPKPKYAFHVTFIFHIIQNHMLKLFHTSKDLFPFIILGASINWR